MDIQASSTCQPNIEERTLWFETWHKAKHYAHRHRINQEPQQREVWLHYAWRMEWSLRVPANWTEPDSQ
jgi:hypothetical protein